VIKLRRSSEPYIGQKPQSEEIAVFELFFYNYFFLGIRFTSGIIGLNRFSGALFQAVDAEVKEYREKNQQDKDFIQLLKECFYNISSGGSGFIRNKPVCS
jgi:hypothetical protein